MGELNGKTVKDIIKENFERSGNSPQDWTITASNLLSASRILKIHRDRYFKSIMAGNNPNPEDGRLLGVELMLRGFAIECLLKATWLKRGEQLVINGNFKNIPGAGSHQLNKLWTEVLSIPIENEGEDLLWRLEFFMTAAGRYPIPTSVDKSYRSNKGLPNHWSFEKDDDRFELLINILVKEMNEEDFWNRIMGDVT